MRGAGHHHREPVSPPDPWNVFHGGTSRTAAPGGPLLPDATARGNPERPQPSGTKRIGEILVGAGVISVETRDRVLEDQGWNRVSFGTALLESGALSEQLLLRALSVQFSVPGASAADLASIPTEILALVKRRVAERLSVVPFRKVGRTLHVAMARPNDRTAIRSLGLLTGCTVVPHVAIAFRVSLAIERHYGVPAAPHFKALARRLDERPAPPPGVAAAAQAAPAPQALVPTAPVPAPVAAPAPTPTPAAPAPWTQLTESLSEARNPDHVALVLLDFLKETVGPSALFLVHGDDAILWRTWPASAQALRLSIPLSARSLLASLRNARDVFTGPCPDTEANRQILASVGERFPGDVVVLPVNLNERTFLYVVCRSPRGGPSIDRASLRRLARIASTALGLVALHRRLRSV
ncbi:MAG: hypothetical protein U0529_18635 [Thermoanaerobaculia bacterium]